MAKLKLKVAKSGRATLQWAKETEDETGGSGTGGGTTPQTPSGDLEG